MISFSLIVVRAAKVEAALSFYSALGLTFVQEQHGSGPIHHSCTLGNVTMEIYPLKAGAEFQPDTSTMIGFGVASLDETLADLAKLGVAPKSAPKNSEWGLWVNVIDPDNRVVQLHEKIQTHIE